MLKPKTLSPDQFATARRPATGNRKWLIIASIFFPLCGFAIAWFQGPLLIRDFGLEGKLAPAKRFHIVSASCRSRLVLNSCEIKAGEFSGSVPREMKLEYMFFDAPFAKHSVQLLEHISDPSVVTTDLGQNNLINRTLTLVSMLLFSFLLPIYLLQKSKTRR
jgi:hypothetical protein